MFKSLFKNEIVKETIWTTIFLAIFRFSSIVMFKSDINILLWLVLLFVASYSFVLFMRFAFWLLDDVWVLIRDLFMKNENAEGLNGGEDSES